MLSHAKGLSPIRSNPTSKIVAVRDQKADIGSKCINPARNRLTSVSFDVISRIFQSNFQHFRFR